MKELWIVIGFISMGLGIIGILLPILPTTPFFLLTAYGFSKGSTRFSTWFQSKPFVQKHLSSLTMSKQKKWTLNLCVDGLLITYIILFDHIVLRIILVSLIGIKHYVFHRYVTTN